MLAKGAKMPTHFSSAYWRARGEETRTIGYEMTRDKLQRPLLDIAETLLDIADEYDKLAEFTEAQERSAD
jgi:hypothetical protein